MSAPVEATVLHVDDDVALLELTAAYLGRLAGRLTVRTESSAESGLQWLRSNPVDCIISDYDMPGRSGLEFLEAVREEFPTLPFVLFTGKGSEEIASAAISAGVTDYLQKGTSSDQFAVLANRVSNLVAHHQAELDLERRARQYEAVADLGRHALEHESTAELGRRSVTALHESLDVDYTKLLQWRPETGDFLLVAGVGWPDGLVGHAIVDGGNRSQSGFTLARAEPVVVSDFATEERFDASTLFADTGIVSGISVVVGTPDEPWGVLAAHSTGPRRFTDHDTTFVQNVANVLAAAFEQRAGAERLRESERRFRRMAELSPDPLFTVDVDGTLSYVSPAAQAVYGYDPAEMTGEHFGAFVTEGDLRVASEAFQSVLDGVTVTDLELGIVGLDGSLVPSVLAAALVEEGGVPVAVQGFVRARRTPRSAG